MSAPESAIDVAPLTCTACGRSSRWREAFIEVRDGTVKRLCCPRCETRHSASERRSNLVWTAVFAVLTFVYLVKGRGHGPDLLVVFALIFALTQFPLTLLHECGHALTARILRVPVYAIVVGREPWLFDRQLLGIRFRMGSLPSGGWTYHATCTEPHATVKDILITAAGPLTNLAISLAAIAVAASLAGSYPHSFARFVLLTVAAGSALQFVWNIWPHKVTAEMGRGPNDGARILNLLRGKREPARGSGGARHYFRALFAFNDGEFETAAREAAKARVRFIDPKSVVAVTVLGAAALSESDDAHGAVALLRPLHERQVDDPGMRSAVLDNLGWAYLLLDEPGLREDAQNLIEAACDIAPWEDSFVISLACAYSVSATLENGRAAEARRFLATMDLKKLKRQNAAYAALAQGLCAIAEGDVAAARTHYAQAQSRGATAAPLRLLERRIASR